MKKLAVLFGLMICSNPLSAMIRAGVDIGPDPVYYEDGYTYDWYGPGVYYGVYYSDYPTYYAWRRRNYYGGPYYYRRSHYHNGYYYRGNRHDKKRN